MTIIKKVKNNMEKVRACLRCKEFVPIHSEDYLSSETLKRFDLKHKNHILMTILKMELSKEYNLAKEV